MLPDISPRPAMGPRARYRLRLSRKHMLWRAFRKRRDLSEARVDLRALQSARIVLCATLRDEAQRLPFFLDHYRRLGVQHFLIVSNGSTDGGDAYLTRQPDVSLWQTEASYKDARFGMDWLTWLQRRHCHGKWVLTVDADELLVYPDCETRRLPDLTEWLDRRRYKSFGALMLDLYPKGSPEALTYAPGQDPTEILDWFDGDGYWSERRGRHQAANIVGGVRARCFFPDAPEAAPVLSKVPLVKWHRSYAYFSSMHVILPTDLNEHHGRDDRPSGVLLHTKFLPGVAARAALDKARGQGFTKRPEHEAYYDGMSEAPDMWSPQSLRYAGWPSLLEAGLMRRGDW